jgi:hypothetical protein
VVGGRALPLAGDLGRYERKPVELRVSVLERRAGEWALIDDQMYARRPLANRPHPLAPRLNRNGQLLAGESGDRGLVARR